MTTQTKKLKSSVKSEPHLVVDTLSQKLETARDDDHGVILIGLTGAARSGKNTVANVIKDQVMQLNDLKETLPETFIVSIDSFAAPIKSMVAMLLDFFSIGSVMNQSSLEPYLEGDKKEEPIPSIGASPRKLMQTLGTDWGRNLISPSLWLDAMKSRLEQYKEIKLHGYGGAVVVVTDVRFDNEAQAIIDAGGCIIRVVRPSLDTLVRGHTSEDGVSSHLVYRVLVNDCELADLDIEVLSQIGDLLPLISDPTTN